MVNVCVYVRDNKFIDCFRWTDGKDRKNLNSVEKRKYINSLELKLWTYWMLNSKRKDCQSLTEFVTSK